MVKLSLVTFSYSLVLKIGGQVVKLALMIFPYNATCFYFMVLAYFKMFPPPPPP